jgi:hypothetical protein
MCFYVYIYIYTCACKHIHKDSYILVSIFVYTYSHFYIFTSIGIIPFVLVTPYMYFLKEKYYKKTNTELESGLKYKNYNENENDFNYRNNHVKNGDKILRSINSELDVDNVLKKNKENDFSICKDDQNVKINLDNVSDNITIQQQLNMIWDTVQLQAVWKPMVCICIYVCMFIYIYIYV